MSEAIPHQIRVSPRAKHVYFRISIQQELQITVPRGYNLDKIPPLIERKRSWIESTKLRVEKYQTEVQPDELPLEIILPAAGEIWRVEYLQKNSRRVTLRQKGANILSLSGNVESKLACKRQLRRWLVRKAQETLVPWLRAVSVELNLPFTKVSVRLQKSRWGSCSRRKTISVNAKLLFLRPELVRYLFVHELSHLVHMNHSARYWQFVAARESDYKQLDAEMGKAMRTIPRWTGY